MHSRLPSKSLLDGTLDRRRHCGALWWSLEDEMCHRKTSPDMVLFTQCYYHPDPLVSATYDPTGMLGRSRCVFWLFLFKPLVQHMYSDSVSHSSTKCSSTAAVSGLLKPRSQRNEFSLMLQLVRKEGYDRKTKKSDPHYGSTDDPKLISIPMLLLRASAPPVIMLT